MFQNQEMPPKGILDHRTIELADHCSAGGTTGARVALDPHGKKWLVKHYAGHTDRVAVELLANAIYRELDIPVPEAGVGSWQGPNGETWIATTYLMLEGDFRQWVEPCNLLAEGFVADALLANWDVIGRFQDNVLWRGSVPIRLDQGGCFVFRAMGKRKPYGPRVVELESMLGEKGQARDAMAVTSALIERKSTECVSILTPARALSLVSDAPFDDDEMRDQIGVSLAARLNWLKGSHFAGTG